jgi:subtilisin family serine protease
VDSIRLKRGQREVTFNKNPHVFGVRLNRGRAANAAALESATGRALPGVRHVDASSRNNVDLFAVPAPADLEPVMGNVRQASASSVVTHTYSAQESPGELFIPVGTMTVQFKPDVPDTDREALLAQHGLEIVKDLSFLPQGYSVRLTQTSTENPLKIAAKLQRDPKIVTAEPDLAFKVALHAPVPSDTLYPEQWHLKNLGNRTGLKAGADVKAEGAWAVTMGSRGVTVCVIDDGFDLGHPDFNVSGKIVAPKDFGDEDGDPSPGTSDDKHGTSCAGVAIAEANGQGVVGLAPGASFMPVRMAEWLTDDSITAMFQHAMDNGADVISCSWSAASPFFPLSTKTTAIIRTAATQGRRNQKGCVILFAAGNENSPLDGIKDGVQYHQGFALHPNVIAVAASNSLDLRSSYSNFGPAIAIAAPSSGSPGRGIVTTDRRGAEGYSTSDFTATFGGTSSATPLAAGLAALILSANPDLTSAEVKALMMDTADKIDAAGGGYQSGHSVLYGHGRINAEQAVRVAAAQGVPPAQQLSKVLLVEHRVNAPLPDLSNTEHALPFPLDVRPRALEVNVDIQHTYSGDLQIVVRAPGGQELKLYDGDGGSQPDVQKVFRSTDDPAGFEALLSQSAKGDWKLKVKDTAQADDGQLRKWSLAVTY